MKIKLSKDLNLIWLDGLSMQQKYLKTILAMSFWEQYTYSLKRPLKKLPPFFLILNAI